MKLSIPQTKSMIKLKTGDAHSKALVCSLCCCCSIPLKKVQRNGVESLEQWFVVEN